MDETYIKVNGRWHYLYRAVDKAGKTVDFLLREQRDEVAARAFFEKAFAANGEPETVTMDKSGANKASMDSINETRAQADPINIRQIKYLNNLVEQDHRFIKKIVRPMMGFKSFVAASSVLAGIELMHMLRKGQKISSGGIHVAEQFYALAG